MNLKQLKNLLEATGLPVAFNHFDEEESVELPFIVYSTPRDEKIYADGHVVYRYTDIIVELYTSIKDQATEARLETILEENQLHYEKSQVWVSQENLYQTLYEFTLEE